VALTAVSHQNQGDLLRLKRVCLTKRKEPARSRNLPLDMSSLLHFFGLPV